VAAFLARRIGFLDIATLVERVLARTAPPAPRSIAEVLDIDRAARKDVSSMIETVSA
jgi:1-deoxy-D-xylulose-5-phosphate reductoisomerase